MKKRIIACAVDLFGRHGVKSITMDRIARELKISKRTLYEYFSCKEVLLSDCLQFRLKHIGMLGEPEEGLIDEMLGIYARIRQLDTERVCRFCHELHKYYDSVYQELVRRLFNYANCCAERVPAAISDGYIRRDVGQKTVRTVIAGYLARLFFDGTCDAKVIQKIFSPEAVLIFIRGIATIKGRAYMDIKLKEI